MRRAPNEATTLVHRDKRRFQPTITSFFAPEDFDSDVSSARREHKVRQGCFPSVPGTVQSDLLSVGMRVRKSVPEGYKTHKTAALGLPSIQTTLSNSHRSTGVTTASEAYSVKPPREPVPDVLTHQRELLPFCGLHKIGGYAEQPVNGGDIPVNMFPLPAEAFNVPFSAHTSSEPLPPNPANPHKRSYHDDENQPLAMDSNFLFAFPMKVAEDEVPISPLSETPSQNLSAAQAALRPFAQPKTRRLQRNMAFGVDRVKESDMDLDLENAGQTEDRMTGTPSDFGEAPFLQPWSSPGREVDMGGL